MFDTKRKPDYSINPLILNRYSSRAMTGEPISNDELMSLFEAARWAPSCYNNQPWRFIYALKGTKHWDTFFHLLVPFNQNWCKNAAVLSVVLSRKVFDRNQKPSKTHSFDAGAAWENLAIEGTSRGLVVHGMQGFDYEKAKIDLKVPDDYEVEAMFAVGKKAPLETLPEDLQKGENPPSGRKKISEFIFEGIFR